MNKIVIYYGPKTEFEKILPMSYKTLTELVSASDAKRNQIILKNEDGNSEDFIPKRESIENLVAYSESYAGITESAVQSFLSLLSGYEINNLFLQNPPIQICNQFEQAFGNIIEVKKYNYRTLTKAMFSKFNKTFSDRIIGQDKVKERILASFYPLMNKTNNDKPVVLMFYGASGIGKTY